MPLTRKDTLLTHEIEGDLVLYDPDYDVVHTLNVTSRFIWERCDGDHTPAQIATDLRNCYAVPLDVARRDVDKILNRLQDLDLIRQEAPA